MGSVEAEAKKIRRIGNIQRAVLTTLLVGGLMLIGAAPAPNVLQLLGPRRNKYRVRHQVNKTLERLVLKDYVMFITKNGRKYARLTKTGKKILAYEQQKAALKLRARKRWDKRWRVVIFDIPEYRRTTRNKLRLMMHECGLVRLQNSVWVFPHDCEDLIVLLKAELKIGNAVLYMVVEKIENDNWLKRYFDLE